MKNLMTSFGISSIAIGLLALSLGACEGEKYVQRDQTLVEGVICSAADRSPIPGAKLFLKYGNRGNLTSHIWHGRNLSVRNIFYADEQGRFSYRFKHHPDSVYAISAEAEGYFANHSLSYFDYPEWRAHGSQDLTPGYLNYLDRLDNKRVFDNPGGIASFPEIRLAPTGYIKLIVSNQSPAYATDRIEIWTEKGMGHREVFSGPAYRLEYLVGPIRAGRYSRVDYTIYSQGVKQVIQDSVNVPPFDTVVFEINY